jgi:hypothetical protein
MVEPITHKTMVACNVPIFGFPCSTVGDDPMGLSQPDQRGNLRLTVILGVLRSYMMLFEVHLSCFIIKIILA